jgi:hypothetical protein
MIMPYGEILGVGMVRWLLAVFLLLHCHTGFCFDQNSDLYGYYPFDGNYLDQSENGRNLLKVSVPSVEMEGRFLQAYRFDNRDPGSPEFLYDNRIYPGSNALTFNLWVKALQLKDGTSAVAPNTIIHFYNTSSSNRIELRVKDQQLNLDFCGQEITTTKTLLINQWSCLAVTLSAVQLCVYFNGELVRSVAIDGLKQYNRMYLGLHDYNSANRRGFTGLIDELRTYSRALSSVEIRELYTTPPINLIDNNYAYWPLNGNINDDSGNQRPAQILGSVQSVPGMHGTAYALDNTNPADNYRQMLYQFCTIAATDELTLAGWIKPTLLQSGTSTTAPHTIFRLYKRQTTNNLELRIRDSKLEILYSLPSLQYLTTHTVPLNTWSHVALTVSKSQLKLYVNDSQPVVLAIGGLQAYDRLLLGLHYNSATEARGLTGAIDDVYVYQRALAANEITELRTRNSPLDHLTSALYGYWTLNAGGGASLPTTRTLALLGAPAFTSRGVFGNAMQLNNISSATREMAYYSDNNGLFAANTSLTLTCWVNPATTQSSVYQTIAHLYRTGSGSQPDLRFEIKNGYLNAYYSQTGLEYATNFAVPANEWSFVALVVAGDRLQLFRNGDKPKTYTLTGFPATAYNRLTLGLRLNTEAAAHGLTGMLDQVRLFTRAMTEAEIRQQSLNGVAGIMNDGQGDFDPWNTTRWADWYSSGKLDKPFEINRSLRFATRTSAWQPDVSLLDPAGMIFKLGEGAQSVWVDGNGLNLDVRKTVYTDVNQLYSISSTGFDSNIEGYNWGFLIGQSRTGYDTPTRLFNCSMYGFSVPFRVSSGHAHPVRISNATAQQNEWGTYINGANVTLDTCSLLENARGGIYAGRGSKYFQLNQNTFRDNDFGQAKTWGDVVFDSCLGGTVTANTHLASLASTQPFREGIAMYRNMGETDVLREDASSKIVFENNQFNGYSMAFEIGSRMGSDVADMSGESREHVYYNVFRNNRINNTTIGYKVNNSGNSIEQTTFTAVTHPIVLHCVFYDLFDIAIRDNPGTAVRCWWLPSDYTAYASWFPWNDDSNGSIPAAQKFIHVITSGGTPTFPTALGDAHLLHADSVLAPSQSDKYYTSHAQQPLDVATGDFYTNLPGDETAVIWADKISNIKGTDYYSIVIYDRNGIEIDRCGRSTTRWGCIAAGDFMSDPGQEIAAAPADPINGKYPVYIFRRGRATPDITLVASNAVPILDIAAGNLKTDGDALDEIVYLRNTSKPLTLIKPSLTSWLVATTSTLALKQIVVGNFDGDATQDEIGALTNTGTQLVFTRAGVATPFATITQPAGGTPWTTLGAGNFDPYAYARDEVVVARASVDPNYEVLEYYHPDQSTSFRTNSISSLGSQIIRLAGACADLPGSQTLYDQLGGSFSYNASQMADWGDHAVVLRIKDTSSTVRDFNKYSSVEFFELYSQQGPLNAPPTLLTAAAEQSAANRPSIAAAQAGADRLSDAVAAANLASSVSKASNDTLYQQPALLWVVTNPDNSTQVLQHSTPLLH